MFLLFSNKLIKLKRHQRTIIKTINDLFGEKQERNYRVHEFISYFLLNETGIRTPKFGVATTVDEVEKIVRKLKINDLVLKAQVFTDGRGKGKFKNGLQSGVEMICSPKQAKDISSQMFNQVLMTTETGCKGRICKRILICERKFFRRAFYYAISLEQQFNGPVIIASSQGDMDIEEVAAKVPEAILYVPIDIKEGLTRETALCIAQLTGFTCEDDRCESPDANSDGKCECSFCRKIKGIKYCPEAEETADLLCKMYELFIKKDALLIEINPYVEDISGQYFVLGAKIHLDDSAKYRQEELLKLHDFSQEDPNEMEADRFGMSFIALDGNIGSMANGSGLAMATMDLIKLNHGYPANFLHVGDTVTVEKVTKSFQIILTNTNICAIFVNMFGWNVFCDFIARAIVSATRSLNLKIPVVVRLQGQKVDDAREIIKNCGLKILFCDDLEKAAQICVFLANMAGSANNLDVEIMVEMKQKTIPRRK